ncbi:MAG: cyclase family protein [Deltaproteobacteria bacterium]|nr:cyclase family protein [Deltaproteobacteria bacterium]MBW1931139.1 cyclase family protein [Deltaproteobacteria bacterium]MBW2025526.1 cyclase family protein [Deltaproteobacteria bacterium]MBW2125430.1 cyclase family protein [Deltaproteobacteria bacterium]
MDLKKLGSLIQQGKIYDLGMEYYMGMPHHPNHPPFAFSLTKLHGEVLYEGGVSACNCLFTTGGHTGTHIDALGHIALKGEVYSVGDITPWQDYDGLKKAGIHEVAPVVTRGVLLDIAALEGKDCLESNYEIGSDILEEAMIKQGCSIEPGDAVLIRTGWIKYFNHPVKYTSHNDGCPGVVEEGADWLVEQGIRYVGSDTIAFEKTPTTNLPVHVILLVKNGIHIIEAMNLDKIAAEKAYEFLFVAIPLKIRGGTASPVRPIAIV